MTDDEIVRVMAEAVCGIDLPETYYSEVREGLAALRTAGFIITRAPVISDKIGTTTSHDATRAELRKAMAEAINNKRYKPRSRFDPPPTSIELVDAMLALPQIAAALASEPPAQPKDDQAVRAAVLEEAARDVEGMARNGRSLPSELAASIRSLINVRARTPSAQPEAQAGSDASGQATLRPCPFCGRNPHTGFGKVEVGSDGEPRQSFMIWCPMKHANVSCSNQQFAREEWNGRSGDVAPPGSDTSGPGDSELSKTAWLDPDDNRITAALDAYHCDRKLWAEPWRTKQGENDERFRMASALEAIWPTARRRWRL